MPDELHLYLWPEVYCYHSYLTAFALAPNIDEARRLIREKMLEDNEHCIDKHLAKAPRLVGLGEGFVVGGGTD